MMRRGWPAARAAAAKSKARTSWRRMVTLGAVLNWASRPEARVGSSSMAIRWAARGASNSVMAPLPGPISTRVRVERSPRAATMRWMAIWSRRKFWPSFDFWGMVSCGYCSWRGKNVAGDVESRDLCRRFPVELII